MLQKETRSVRFAAVGVIVGSVGMVALVALALLPLLRPTVNVYPSPREVVDTASTTLVNNLHATGSATIDGATVAHKLTNTGALNTTNTADGWVSLVTESASAFDFTAPPYSPVTLPFFSVNDATADAALSHCTGVNCAEVLGWPVCAYHGTGLNGADAACYDGPVIGDDSTWRTSVTTPSVTSTSVSDLTVAAGGFNNTVIGNVAGATLLPAASASTMLTVDASKHLTSYAGSTCAGGTFANGISAAGALACATAGAVTPSVAIPASTAQTVSSLSLSAEGTIDWAYTGLWPASGQFFNVPPASVHSKSTGRWVMQTMMGISQSGVTSGTASPATITYTSTAADDYFQSALSAVNYFFLTTSGGVLSGFGFTWTVQAPESQRVLRVYGTAASAQVTLRCQLSLSRTVASDTFDSTSGGVGNRVWVVTFTGGVGGDELKCNFTDTANESAGAGSSIGLAAVTVGVI